MINLFTDITEGLVKQGYEVKGGNNSTFLVLKKGDNEIKVYADNYTHPNHFIVRYSVKSKEEELLFD